MGSCWRRVSIAEPGLLGMNRHEFAPRPHAPQQPLQEALALHRQGKHELAMQRYVAILQQNPGNVDALYYVAMIAIQQEQFADGLKVMRARARTEPVGKRGCITSRARCICGRMPTTRR